MEDNQLLNYVFGKGNLFAPAFSHWIEPSERFKSFAQIYKDKIRKKMAEAQKGHGNNEEALKDVLYELHMAYLMLRCDQFTEVHYERYGTGKRRSPDFTVTFESGVVFNVEVKRIREGLPEVRLATWKRQMRSRISTIPSSLALSVHILRDRFDNPVGWLNRLEKETPNMIRYFDFGEALKSLAELVARGKDDFFTQKGFSGVDDFLNQARKLSGVLFRSSWVPLPGNGIDESRALWHNTEAHGNSLLPPEIGRTLEAMS